MISSSKFKSLDFYRKIPRDLTEASLSGAVLSIIAALSMMFLFGMELSNYLTTTTSTTVIVDKSDDSELMRIDFNLSFPALSCEFASVDVNDVLGTNRLNITKTIRKYSIDHDLKPTGSEFHSELDIVHGNIIKHGDGFDEEHKEEGSITLTTENFDIVANAFPIMVVNFYAPWCYWSSRLKPSWEKAAKIIRERHDPDRDGRIIMGKVDCTEEPDLCARNHIQGFPSIRIFRQGTDLREEDGEHEHESYYGNRDTDSLVKMMEYLVDQLKPGRDAISPNASTAAIKRPAPSSGGCRIEGFVRVKKIPGNLIISARSRAHSFDTTQMNMSHIVNHLSFGMKVSSRLISNMQMLIPYIGLSHDKLDGRAFINQYDLGANVTIEHYLQIVKSEVISKKMIIEEYEYTAHTSVSRTLYIPAAKFHIQVSPMQVLITEDPKSFSHFITNLCAIIGGVFTVAGILDSIFHNTIKVVKKVELGKNF